MRSLVTLVLLAVLGWTGWWLIAAAGTRAGFERWFAQRQAEGWTAELAQVSVRGFPDRLETTLTGIELADPRSGLAWRAPRLAVRAKAWQPHHVVVLWPEEQSLATPAQSLTVTAGEMRAEIDFAPGPALLVERALARVESLGLVSSRGWTSALEAGAFQLHRVPSPGSGSHVYDISATATGLRPASQLVQALSDLALLPERMQGAELRATVTFDAPWDRYAIERARPQPSHVKLDVFKADWGELGLWLAGEADVDAQGRPTGQVTLRAHNWRAILEAAERAGLLPPDLRAALEGALDLVAQATGSGEDLDVTLTLSAGLVFFGPLPLGRAPLLRLP